MPNNIEKRFWVIFDTCTRPAYYQDLHKLIALPRGATIRYEYRENYLTEAAKSAASNGEFLNTGILLLYAQGRQYQKGSDISRFPPPSSEILWVATRLGEMQSIVQDGANFFFDFKVLGYPGNDAAQIMKILAPKIDKNEVPFNKWVCLADDITTFHQIASGADDENWQSIVDMLGSAPNQFSGDSFWRLRGLFRSETKEPLSPKYKKQVGTIVSYYEIPEKESMLFDVVSYNPLGTSQPERKLDVRYDKEGPFALVGDGSYNLRQYTSFNIELKAKRYEEIEERAGTIGLNTSPQPDDWPVGPNLSIRMTARKGKWRTAVSIIMLIGGGVLLLLATKLWDINHTVGTLIGIIGMAVLAFKELLTSGKLPVKL